MENPSARNYSYRTRGQRIAGSIYLGVGVAAVGAALAARLLFPGAGPEGVLWIRIALGLFAAAFLLVGLILAFKDREVATDPTGRVLGIGWSWLRWRRMTLYEVEPGARILLQLVEERAGPNTTTTYPVSYVHERGAAEIVRGADYRLARRRAETLARSLGLPLVDRTSGSEVVRAPDALDRSVADPATLPAGLVWPALRPGTRIRVRCEQGTLFVTIPPPGFCGLTFFALGLLAVGGALLWVLVTITLPQVEGAGGMVFVVALCALALLFAFGGLYGLADTLWRTRRLVVSPRGIGRPRREGDEAGELVEASAIEEVDLTAGDHGVLARTDELDVELGAYLTPEEARCVRDMVRLALAGRVPRREPDGR